MAWADARLCELEPLDRGVPSVKETYKRIVREGWQINHGRGIGPVCGGAARDSEDDDAARLAAEDTEEPLATEIAEDEADAPGRAWGTPNPFSAATTVSYVVTGPAPQEVALAVYDLAGRKVSDLAGGSQAPGVHDVQWDGRGAD